MITNKEKDDYLNSLIKGKRTFSLYSEDKPDEQRLNLLRGLRDKGLIKQLNINSRNMHISFTNKLVEFMDSGGFSKENIGKVEKISGAIHISGTFSGDGPVIFGDGNIIGSGNYSSINSPITIKTKETQKSTIGKVIKWVAIVISIIAGLVAIYQFYKTD